MVDFLIKVCGLDFSEDEILRATGILRTNSLHIQHPEMKKADVSAGGMFPTFSLLSHSCVCNAKYRYAYKKTPDM